MMSKTAFIEEIDDNNIDFEFASCDHIFFIGDNQT